MFNSTTSYFVFFFTQGAPKTLRRKLNFFAETVLIFYDDITCNYSRRLCALIIQILCNFVVKMLQQFLQCLRCIFFNFKALTSTVMLPSLHKAFYCTDNYSATSNNMKLVHWPLMGELLHLVQRGGHWAGPQPAQASSRCTKCNSPPINGQCTNHRIAV